MTEQEWLTSEDPRSMLENLQAWRGTGAAVPGRHDPLYRVSDRKLLLFVASCVRTFGEQGVIRVSPPDDLEATADEGQTTIERHCYPRGLARSLAICQEGAAGKAHLLREVIGNPFRPVTLPGRTRTGPLKIVATSGASSGDPLTWTWQECPWLTWQDGTVPRLARTIYDGRQWESMPILADALEEAGAPDGALLRHLRGQQGCSKCHGTGLGGDNYTDDTGKRIYCIMCYNEGWVPLRGPHCRGCWAVDLLLGLS